jgi:4-amino-4-deoxy-L-arabinose transferase-like glycosyltransferase
MPHLSVATSAQATFFFLAMTYRNLLWFIFAAAVVRLLLLGLSPLMDTTEARYGEISRLMVELNDWVTPWFTYDMPFWGKPPLAFWISALSFKVFGINEFAARFPHWLAGMVVLWILWGMRPRSGPTGATYAIALLLGSVMFFVASGMVMMDMALVIGTTLAMRGFWNGLHGEPSRRGSERWLLFIGLGIALLAKGPVGVVLTGLPCGIWALVSGKLRMIWRDLPWVRGCLLTLLIALPWYVIAELRSPGFINYFIVGEHFHRFVTPGWQGDLYGTAHKYPYGTIWLFMLADVLPWTILFPIIAWQTRGAKAAQPLHPEKIADDAKPSSWRNYLLLWAFMPAVFFTMAGNIIWPYVLPGMPALALLVGGWLASRAQQNLVRLNLAVGLSITMVLAAGFNASMPFTGRSNDLAAKTLIEDYRSRTPSGLPLIYLEHRPFSASFYSQGQALLEKTPETLIKRLESTPAYVAIRTSSLDYMPPALMSRLERLSKQGYFTLYLRKGSQAAVPEASPAAAPVSPTSK